MLRGFRVGTLHITALTGYGEQRLFPALEKFRIQHPKIICDVHLTDSYLDLSTGEVDIAIRATADPPEYLVAKRLHGNRWGLVASPRYIAKHGRPQSYSDIENHASIGFRGPRGLMPWLAKKTNGEVVEIARNPTFITNHGLQILHATIAGEGLSYLPIWGVSKSIAAGQLEEITLDNSEVIFSTGPEMSMYLLYDPSKARLGKMNAMVDFLRAELTSDKF